MFHDDSLVSLGWRRSDDRDWLEKRINNRLTFDTIFPTRSYSQSPTTGLSHSQ